MSGGTFVAFVLILWDDVLHLGNIPEGVWMIVAVLGAPLWAQKIGTEALSRDRIMQVHTALNHLTVIEVGEPVVTVELNTSGRAAGDVTADIQARLAKMRLPAGVRYTIGGDAEKRKPSCARQIGGNRTINRNTRNFWAFI